MWLKTIDSSVNTSTRSIVITNSWTRQQITMRDAIGCFANDVVNECFGCGCGSCLALYLLMWVRDVSSINDQCISLIQDQLRDDLE